MMRIHSVRMLIPVGWLYYTAILWWTRSLQMLPARASGRPWTHWLTHRQTMRNSCHTHHAARRFIPCKPCVACQLYRCPTLATPRSKNWTKKKKKKRENATLMKTTLAVLFQRVIHFLPGCPFLVVPERYKLKGEKKTPTPELVGHWNSDNLLLNCVLWTAAAICFPKKKIIL